MSIKLIILATVSLVLSANVNAVVLNTLNGVDYEWLELTETTGLSRSTVESRIMNVNDVLYGYEYASRQLIEDLFLSYTSWDGISGEHGAAGVVMGISSIQSDFGVTATYAGNGVDSQFVTVDGITVNYDGYIQARGYYGTIPECGSLINTCFTVSTIYTDTAGNKVMAFQGATDGWDAGANLTFFASTTANSPEFGSYLVRPAVVPMPAAVWLFGSGLIGLVGLARRKT